MNKDCCAAEGSLVSDVFKDFRGKRNALGVEFL
jgi:hypothetical protein